jgi:hypothetical protein
MLYLIHQTRGVLKMINVESLPTHLHIERGCSVVESFKLVDARNGIYEGSLMVDGVEVKLEDNRFPYRAINSKLVAYTNMYGEPTFYNAIYTF